MEYRYDAAELPVFDQESVHEKSGAPDRTLGSCRDLSSVVTL